MSYLNNVETTPYTGIFVRQTLGQKPSDISQGSCSCPDIITDTSMPPDPTIYTTPTGYGTQYPNNVNLNNENFVYMRGLQANGYTGGTNFFFYYVESDLALWPQNWTLAKAVTVGTANPPGTYQNWVYAPNPSPGNTGQYVLGNQPILWTPTPPSAGNHYCVICWADNSTQANPQPPDLSYYGQMSSFNDLMVFLAQHPNMGWLNTNDNPTPPPGQTYQTLITTKSNETVNITVYFNNITSGTFTVMLVGDVNYSSGPLDVSKYQGGFPVPSQSFPANSNVTLQVIGTPGNQAQYQRISANIVQIISPTFMDFLAPMMAMPGVSLPIKKTRLAMEDGSLGNVEDVFVLGQQTWNLNFNA